MNLRVRDKIFLVLMVVGFGYLAFSKIFLGSGETNGPGEFGKARVEVGRGSLEVRVADDEKTRYQGLSGTEELSEGEGMLFIHEEPGRHAYVMRGMYYDLDFIFIKDEKVVDLARRVAWSYQGEVQGATEYDKVLEVPAGWARRNEVEIGEEVDFSF
jgi:uncharacterized membrane protein (UPF0127 family)